ncbi:MAG: rhodanese-like domain-containing protein [Pseudomonadota bacterium]|nr:rhodanese-like domain-containing protein [Pseudomonadota bacterium]|tara:strand:+ start:2549 stop:2986 length:438 start_codon:yes stop_codon:yes gene_type:complete
MEQLIEFFGNHLILSSSFFIVLFMIFFLEIGALTNKFKPLTYSELTNLINKDKVTLVDFRAEKEYMNGHIINSVNLSIASIKTNNFNKQQPIIAYSDNDRDSINAAKEYVKLGYQMVYYLQGGIQSWIENNMPLTGVKNHGKRRN